MFVIELNEQLIEQFEIDRLISSLHDRLHMGFFFFWF